MCWCVLFQVMDRLGKPVPLGWGTDRNGAPCDNAAEVGKHGGLTPLGGSEETAGYKVQREGCNLSMLTDLTHDVT